MPPHRSNPIARQTQTSERGPSALAHAPYVRARDLPRLLPVWPDEIADTSDAGRLRLLIKLQSQLRRERQRGLAGHWAYDLARHRQLLIAYRAELAACPAFIGFARNFQRAHLDTPSR